MLNTGALTSPKDRYRILLVDDSSLIRNIVKRHCLAEEIDVVECENLSAAREVLKIISPDLILLNVVLPDGQGTDFCREIRESLRLKWVPVILVTALNNLEIMREGYDCGADDYVIKPFSPEELIMRVKSRIRRARALQFESMLDSLTGCHTRGYFQARLEEEIFRVIRQKTVFGLVIIDLDDFKKVNDTYGHLAGDFVLSEFGKTLRAAFRKNDVIARYGGEEFALLLPETAALTTVRVVERLRETWSNSSLALPSTGERLTLTFSAGVAESTVLAQKAEPSLVLAAADRALYRAKAQGKNCTVCAHDLEQP